MFNLLTPLASLRVLPCRPWVVVAGFVSTVWSVAVWTTLHLQVNGMHRKRGLNPKPYMEQVGHYATTTCLLNPKL